MGVRFTVPTTAATGEMNSSAVSWVGAAETIIVVDNREKRAAKRVTGRMADGRWTVKTVSWIEVSWMVSYVQKRQL